VTIADSTPVASRVIDVTGSSVGKFNVAPVSLSFNTPATPVGSVSTEDTVVVGNDGPGQLSVTPTLTGFSSAQFKLGPTNTCTAPLAAGTGCEIGVQFAPTTTGVKNATLHLADPSGQTSDVALQGTGTTATPVAPGAPTIGTATAGDAQATVTWTAPTAKGSPTLTGYKVQAFAGTSTTPASTTAVTGATATSGTVAGLTNGTSYTFKVLATNGTQDSTPSAASNAVTPTAPATNAAPTVTGRTPAINATGFTRTGNILVTFSEPVTNVTTSTVVLKGPAGGVIATTITKDTTVANRWIVNPTPALAATSKYTLTLTGGTTGIKDTATPAAALVATASSPLSWSFTTGP